MNPGLAVLVTLAAFLAEQTAPTFRTGVDVVELDVSVMRGGHPLRELTAGDFEVRDRGVLQKLTTVAVDRLPLSVVLVFDVSSSVQGERLHRLIEAGRALVKTLRPGERAALVTFSHRLTVRVPLTERLETIDRSLQLLNGGGATALRDAVCLALGLAPIDQTRPLVLVFSDGQDNASWLGEQAIVAAARRTGVVIHAVEVAGQAGVLLKTLTDATGGRLWSASSNRQLQELFTSALEEMRARYLLSFAPTDPGAGWHDLTVTLKNGHAEVVARPGYLVGSSNP